MFQRIDSREETDTMPKWPQQPNKWRSLLEPFGGKLCMRAY